MNLRSRNRVSTGRIARARRLQACAIVLCRNPILEIFGKYNKGTTTQNFGVLKNIPSSNLSRLSKETLGGIVVGDLTR